VVEEETDCGFYGVYVESFVWHAEGHVLNAREYCAWLALDILTERYFDDTQVLGCMEEESDLLSLCSIIYIWDGE